MSPSNRTFGSSQQRMKQMAGQLEKSSGGSGGGSGGGWDPSLYRSFRPKKGVPTMIRILQGDYENARDGGSDPCYSFYEHRRWDGKKLLTVPCTLKPGHEKDAAEDCVSCYYQNKGDDSIKRGERKVFSIIVLEHFHVIEQPSRSDATKTVKYPRECKKRGCDMCKEEVKKDFGARMWWSLGKNHFDQLAAANGTLGKHCTCGGKVNRVGFECSEGHTLLEVESSNMTDEKIELFSQEETKCRECSYAGLPVEILECNKCEEPTRLDIFGVNLWVMKQGEKTSSHIVVDDWEAEGIPEDYKGKVEGWDFAKFLTYPGHDSVAQRLGVTEPFSGSGGGESSVPYDDKRNGGSGRSNPRAEATNSSSYD